MPFRFASIFSHLTHLTNKDQRNVNQASHLVSIGLILHNLGFGHFKNPTQTLKGKHAYLLLQIINYYKDVKSAHMK